MPLRQRDGWVDIPEKPGLGIEVSRDVIKRFSVR
jgi:L-alanine-DL-glutamate epimerase-like enolase superfamily enzyme